MKIGFDLDNVVAIPTIPKMRNPVPRYETSEVNSKIFSILSKDDELILITGRNPRYKEKTLAWLKKKNVPYDRIIFDYKNKERTHENTAIFKAKTIKKLGIERYYEDDEEKAVKIKELVPKCKVFIVREGNILGEILKIDPEFESLLPSLASYEYKRLKKNIRKDGKVLDKIKVWKGKDIIVDGHHRYRYCLKNKLPFEIEELEFKNRREVRSWIRTHQYGHRNLNSKQENYYVIYKEYEDEKKLPYGRTDREFGGVKGKPSKLIRTRDKIAKRLGGISPSRVDKANNFGKAVDKLVEYGLDEDKKSKFLSGKIKGTQKDIIELASFERGKIKIIKKINSGKANSLIEAALLVLPKQKRDEFLIGYKTSNILIKQLSGLREFRKINPDEIQDPPVEIDSIPASEMNMTFMVSVPRKQYDYIMETIKRVDKTDIAWSLYKICKYYRRKHNKPEEQRKL